VVGEDDVFEEARERGGGEKRVMVSMVNFNLGFGCRVANSVVDCDWSGMNCVRRGCNWLMSRRLMMRGVLGG
jgi:hypothetical protein